MEEYPDELRTKTTPAAQPGTSRLGDFLREAASWDPDVEQLVDEAVRTARSGNSSPRGGGCSTSGS